MNKIKFFMVTGCIALSLASCNNDKKVEKQTQQEEFQWVADRFGDVQVLRYQVPGFENLSMQQKAFLYYLQEAAVWGRDMIYDQNYRHNLCIRRTLEAVITHYQGDKNDADFQKLMEYAKKIWFCNGIHHHYSTDKFLPEFSQEYFSKMVAAVPVEKLPLTENETPEMLITRLIPIMFNPEIDAKRVCLDGNKDVIAASCCNFYEGVTGKEVDDYYKKIIDVNNPRPLSYGINSKMMKENGKIVEKVWKLDGMYGASIAKIIENLELAKQYASSEKQKSSIDKMIEFYKTGDLKTFDDYSIMWVQDTDPEIDFTNGFIEVYGDPIGKRGSFQSVVYMKDVEMTKQMQNIAKHAQWFEDNSPILPQNKKDTVSGISYKVVTVTTESGDNAPSTPIGVNLPNADWIRSEYGSKSVSLGNIENSYEESAKNSGTLATFFLPEEQEIIKKYSHEFGKLHTALHEVIGHASGKIEPGVAAPDVTLKNYSSALEEARAELVALYYIGNEELVKLGVSPNTEIEKATYANYITNGLMRQMTRLKLGQQIEQAHMTARSMISHWCYEHGKTDNVIEKLTVAGATYFRINDYDKLRGLVGELLREVQRIKSQGDFEAGKNLVETYGKPVDLELHKEVLERYAKLNIPPYAGFIQPQIVPVIKDGKVVDYQMTIPENFTEQMLFYAEKYTTLPTYN